MKMYNIVVPEPYVSEVTEWCGGTFPVDTYRTTIRLLHDYAIFSFSEPEHMALFELRWPHLL